VRDRDVREALRSQALREHIADPQTLVLDELGLLNGNARVDVAVINGVIHGYELKSATDTLTRLPSQIVAYGAVLDFVTLVVAENHRDRAVALIPRWWGVLVAREVDGGAIKLTAKRKARMNPAIDPSALARLLWRDEALDELMSRGLADGMRSKPRRAIYAKLTESVPLPDLREVVRSRLKQRATWRTGRPRTSRGGSPPPSATS